MGRKPNWQGPYDPNYNRNKPRNAFRQEFLDLWWRREETDGSARRDLEELFFHVFRDEHLAFFGYQRSGIPATPTPTPTLPPPPVLPPPTPPATPTPEQQPRAGPSGDQQQAGNVHQGPPQTASGQNRAGEVARIEARKVREVQDHQERSKFD